MNYYLTLEKLHQDRCFDLSVCVCECVREVVKQKKFSVGILVQNLLFDSTGSRAAKPARSCHIFKKMTKIWTSKPGSRLSRMNYHDLTETIILNIWYRYLNVPLHVPVSVLYCSDFKDRSRPSRLAFAYCRLIELICLKRAFVQDKLEVEEESRRAHTKLCARAYRLHWPTKWLKICNFIRAHTHSRVW